MSDNIIRQGDVALVPVDFIPHRARFIKRSGQRVTGKGIILAEGEATGHHHAVKERGARLYQLNGRRYLRVPGTGAALVHEEHDAIPLAPGAYEVKRQREYTPPEPRTGNRASTQRVWD